MLDSLQSEESHASKEDPPLFSKTGDLRGIRGGGEGGGKSSATKKKSSDYLSSIKKKNSAL